MSVFFLQISTISCTTRHNTNEWYRHISPLSTHVQGGSEKVSPPPPFTYITLKYVTVKCVKICEKWHFDMEYLK